MSLTSDNEMIELFDLARKHSISPIRMKVGGRGRHEWAQHSSNVITSQLKVVWCKGIT